MRLLVYGGNAFEERRRIGEWSEEITPKILQNRAGLSEARPSFGVGISDDAPFLIYRRLHGYGGRSYPLVILLDPGTELWQLYDWNAAHILLTLFGDSEAPGSALLESPERFYNENDLSRLIQKLETKAELPTTPIRSIADTETFKKYWFGAMALDAPVVQVADEKTILIRPTIAEMCLLLEEIPPSIRCAKGWLMGGSRSLVPIFDVHYVIDDQAESMSAQTDSSVNEKLCETGSRLLKTYSIAKDLFNADKDNEKGNLKDRDFFKNIKDFFNQPFFIWSKRNNASTEKAFEEFYLLANLHPRTQNPDRDVSSKTLEYLNENKGVFVSEVKTLSILFLHEKDKNKDSREGWDLTDAELARLVKYPHEKKINLKAISWLNYLISVIKSTDSIEDIRRTLDAELKLFNDKGSWSSLKSGNWQQLADAVILRISEILRTPSPNEFAPLTWKETFSPSNEALIYEQFYYPFEREFEKFVRSDRAFSLPEFHKIYLIYGNDADGEWLFEKQHAEYSEVINNILRLLAKKGSASEKYQSEIAEKWLNKLIAGNNFYKISQAQRFKIFEETDFNGWTQLTEIFSFKVFRHKHAKSLDKLEKDMLASELPHWKEFGDNENVTPQLVHLTELLGKNHYQTIFDIFGAVKPPLERVPNDIVVKWLEGWNELARNGNKDESKAKLLGEAARLMFLKPPDDWFKIIKSAKIPAPELCRNSAKAELVRIGRGILNDEDLEDADSIQRFRNFFANEYFSETSIISEIYDSFPVMPEPGEVNFDKSTMTENIWRRIASDDALRSLFEKELKPEKFNRLIENLNRYYKKQRIKCLDKIENLTEKWSPAQFQHSIERLKNEFGTDVLAQAAQTFFAKYRDAAPEPERYNQMKRVLSPYLEHSEQKSFIEKEIYMFLFEPGESDASPRIRLINNLNNSRTETKSCINKAVINFLKDPADTKGKTFFERYLLERIKDDKPSIDRHYNPDAPNSGDLPSHIFEPLDAESQIRLLENLCENESIDTHHFGQLIWSEYGDAIDVAEDTRARNQRKIRHPSGEIIEIENEESKTPSFSPLQYAVLRFLGSISDKSEQQLLNARKYAIKNHPDNLVKLNDNLEKWGIIEKKKADAEPVADKDEAVVNGKDKKHGSSLILHPFEFLAGKMENRTLGNLFVPEFFNFLDERQDKLNEGQ